MVPKRSLPFTLHYFLISYPSPFWKDGPQAFAGAFRHTYVWNNSCIVPYYTAQLWYNRLPSHSNRPEGGVLRIAA